MSLQRREFEVFRSELEHRAQFCGISTGEMTVLVGDWPIRPCEGRADIETAARQLYELLGLARRLLGQDASDWLRQPDTGLNGRIPMSFILEDRRKVVILRNILRREVDAS